jgi:hypothetical protein
MRGFYIGLDGYPQRVHELRDGDYPLCGAGAVAKQPVTRTERTVTCPRCLRIMSEEDHKNNRCIQPMTLMRPPY